MGLRVTKNTIAKFEKKFTRELKKTYRDVADFAVEQFQSNFEKGSYFGKPWKANLDGHTPILVRSGSLRRGIRVKSVRDKKITIINDARSRHGKRVYYARIHNEGGNVSYTPTENQKKFFWAKYKQTGNIKYKNMALATKIDFEMPKRQFMGESKTLNKRIEKFLSKKLRYIIKKSKS